MRTYSFPTAETVIDQAVAEAIGSTASSLTALQTTSLLRKLDNINREFVDSAHTRHHGGAWSWMQDVTNFQTKNATTLNGALTTASTSVIFESDIGFDATNGRIWVKTSKGAIDFIDYTAFATLTATGATDIDMAHADGEKVEKLYALPSTFAKVRKLLINGSEYIYRKQELLPYFNTFYTRGSFIVLPEGIGEQDGTLYFEKAPTDIATGDSTADLARSLDIPEDFMWYAVNKLMAYMYGPRRKREDKATALAEAEIELERALNYDINHSSPQGLSTDY